ncbi:MAG TPA: hypothetical protein DCF42_04545 [Lachnospiraceae bacterium]|nr:hypothetical protein [Lachnospiraceae bacterium]
MKKLSKGIVKSRFVILILGIVLLVPSLFGYIHTKVNYDILSYLPKSIDSMKGQDIMLDEFGTGAFSTFVVDGMSNKDVVKLKSKIEKVNHVKKVLWYDDVADISVPTEILPDKARKIFMSDKGTLMFIIYDSSMSSTETMQAVEDIRAISNKQCFLSGMSAVVLDIKNLTDKEAPVYVVIAVILSFIVLALTMDSFLVPVFFLLSIGMAIMYNLGTNAFLGDVSYITKAICAVLQLGVTMDYSIFLWHSYEEERDHYEDHKEAMAVAIQKTFVSVIGSSITTIAGFIALCFMTFALGLNLGVVMAKGVVFGVIGCVTILPSFILIFDKALIRTRHKVLLPDVGKVSRFSVKKFPVFIILFCVLIFPAFYGQNHTNVYYNLVKSVPKTLQSVVASDKLKDEFNQENSQVILFNKSMSAKDEDNMVEQMEHVKGINNAFSLESILGNTVPENLIPKEYLSDVESGKYKIALVTSEYEVGSNQANRQCRQLQKIVHSYDSKAMVVGEASATNDLIRITNHDFNVVNAVSIVLIFVIVAFVFRSISLPIILVSTIEFAIFVNMGIPFFTGASLPFIASIVIGTIQLGSTVDYAILLTNRYKMERFSGKDKRTSIEIAVRMSAQSILVSALSFFVATFGVSVYSNVDIISSLCTLMARGAIISMLTVIFILPAWFMVFDRIICATSVGFRMKKSDKEETERKEGGKVEAHQ